MARDEGHRRGMIPVGQRDPCIGGNGDRRTDAGHNLKGDARLPEHLCLLTAAAEDERIAALDAGDHRPVSRLFNEASIDLILDKGVLAYPFSGVDPADIRPGMAENLGIDQMVVNDHIGLPDALHPRRVISPGSPGPAPMI